MKSKSTTKNISTPRPITNSDDEIRKLTEEDLAWSVSGKQIENAKKQTTIRLKQSTIMYFQAIANQTGIPYQTLINMYLDDCAKNRRMPDLTWK